MFVSITRLKLKSILSLPAFYRHAIPSMNQSRKSEGVIHSSVSSEGLYTHLTLTVWQSREHMIKFLRSGPHLEAMKRTGEIAKEAHSFGYESENVPSWKEAKEKLKSSGVSKIHLYQKE